MNYVALRQDGVEVLVSRSLSPYLRGLHLDTKKFLFMRSLKVEMQLANGLVVA